METGKIKKAFRGEKKKIALLIDPDKHQNNKKQLYNTIDTANKADIDFIFIGGSLTAVWLDDYIDNIKEKTDKPVILFPGSLYQVSLNADAILFISLISGRNPEYLIGQQVASAQIIKNSNLEVLPTGYILVDGGKTTSVQYISATMPIPADKPDLITATAIAGEMLGLRHIYLEAGSGALHPVSPKVISEVKKNIDVPLIVGGGIRNAKVAAQICEAGADIIVVGNAAESSPNKLMQIANALKQIT